MKFSLETLKLLKNFTSISDVLYLNNEKGVVVLSPTGSFLGCAETEEDLDKGNCVFYNWSTFLSTIQAFGNEEAELEFKEDENHVLIKNQTGGKLKYFYTNPRLVAKDYKKPKEFEDYQIDFEHDAKIELTQQIWNELKKSSSIMSLDKLTITVEENKANVVLSNSEGVNSSEHEQEIEAFSGTGEISINFSTLNIIPGDYEILIKNNKAVKIINKDIPVFYVLGRMKGNTK